MYGYFQFNASQRVILWEERDTCNQARAGFRAYLTTGTLLMHEKPGNGECPPPN